MSISGKWSGYYFHRDVGFAGDAIFPSEDTSTFPIEANFVCIDGVLTGTMIDLRRREKLPHWFVVMRQHPELGKHDQAVAFSRLYDGPKWHLRVSLPAFSSLSGHCDGDRIQFIKSYQGTATESWTGYAPDRISNITPEAVVYEGIVSENLSEISGTWKILAPLTGTNTEVASYSGTFRLVRGRYVRKFRGMGWPAKFSPIRDAPYPDKTSVPDMPSRSWCRMGWQRNPATSDSQAYWVVFSPYSGSDSVFPFLLYVAEPAR